MTAVIVPAPAKLTLTLRVTGVRHDGYHLVDAEMVELELADTLEIEATTSNDTHVELRGPYAEGLPVGPDNLVVKALHLVGRRARVTIDKQIPAGGGLGGGSADAAAILRWAGWDDVAGASRLGADVPFCLVGGRARVTGIGEVVDPLPRLPLELTVLVPPLHVSTPQVYREWDDLGGPRAEGPNDLEPAAIRVEPRLARYRDRFAEVTGQVPVLAGSGASWFVTGHHAGAAAAFDDARVITTRAAI